VPQNWQKGGYWKDSRVRSGGKGVKARERKEKETNLMPRRAGDIENGLGYGKGCQRAEKEKGQAIEAERDREEERFFGCQPKELGN